MNASHKNKGLCSSKNLFSILSLKLICRLSFMTFKKNSFTSPFIIEVTSRSRLQIHNVVISHIRIQFNAHQNYFKCQFRKSPQINAFQQLVHEVYSAETTIHFSLLSHAQVDPKYILFMNLFPHGVRSVFISYLKTYNYISDQINYIII